MEFPEIEFIAEGSERIKIVPSFSEPVIRLISGDVGPFQAGLPVEVPLWIAVHLKILKRCRILPPEWLTEDFFANKLREETDSTLVTAMPSQYYFEVAKLIFAYAEDDVPGHGAIRTAIKDVFDCRTAKLRSSIDLFFKSTNTHAKLNDITPLELRLFRPHLVGAMDSLHDLRSTFTSAVTAQHNTSTNIGAHSTLSFH